MVRMPVSHADVDNWLAVVFYGRKCIDVTSNDFKREGYQNCSVLCCVRQLYTMIRTHVTVTSAVLCWFRFSILCVFLF